MDLDEMVVKSGLYDSIEDYYNKQVSRIIKYNNIEEFINSLNKKTMENKKIKINPPEGYVVDEENSTFEEIVFKRIENKMPDSWEDIERFRALCPLAT